MFGNAILDMLGKKNPTAQLLQAMQQGQGGAPQPAGGAQAGAQAGAHTDPAGAAPAQPQQPQAYTSPPELAQLYTQLMDRQRKETMIDRGIGMLGAAFAQPENRSGIMQAFGGGGGGSSGGSNPMGMISGLMEMQQQQTAIAQKAAQRAAIPAIAAQYGIDVKTAQYLFDTGKLDTVLSEMLKPDNQIVTLADGTSTIVDKRTGKVGEAFGPAKPREIEIRTDDRGNQFAIYKDTGQKVGGDNLVNGQGATNDEQLWRADEADRGTRGLPSRSLSEFLQENNRSRAGAANLGPTGVDYGQPPKDMAWKRDAQGNIAVDEQGRPMAVPIAGGPMDVEKQAADAKEASSDGQKTLTSGLITSSIDDITKIIDKGRDSWLPGPTGYGAVAKWLPSTDARSLGNSLDTVKANIGFEKLQQMREASPTGGALGQVSDFENKLLQSTFGSLDQFGDQASFMRNLYRVKALSDAIVHKGVADQASADAIITAADKEAEAFLGKGSPKPGTSDVQDLLDKYK
jgi:hypothetical protein